MIIVEKAVAKAQKLFFPGSLVGENPMFKAHATSPILTKWLLLLYFSNEVVFDT
jgi:hypothetical protein